ncbi:three-helix bundle dimerization domain-containing protein [Monashia sp. NPDC004114]
MEEVVARLSERFPGVALEVIEAAVRVAHEGLEGPVRDYVPVLVEHAARDRIAAFADRPDSPQAERADSRADLEMASEEVDEDETGPS